ncbi:hypothetical protein RRSWK_05350 [Rhodopirellula sp. SWK7]|nr:hypothetical protein RRSWK_05350 [Rhodopirellula sp. SWK7]
MEIKDDVRISFSGRSRASECGTTAFAVVLSMYLKAFAFPCVRVSMCSRFYVFAAHLPGMGHAPGMRNGLFFHHTRLS